MAENVTGLYCRTEYVIHSTLRMPYPTDRTFVRRRLLGGKELLGFIPVKNERQLFQEEFNLTNPNEGIFYHFEVEEERTVLSVELRRNGSEIILIDRREFNTDEGIRLRIPLNDLIHIGEENVQNVTLTCLPSY